MRYQEHIYINNENSVLRNKIVSNFNMSSDICVFESPLFSMSGASKIDCGSGNTGTTYIVTSATTIPLTFQFTANTQTFPLNNTLFSYEVYKFNNLSNSFQQSPVYKSNTIDYTEISGTSATTQSLPISSLYLDGEYLIKGYYSYNTCTEFMSKLDKKIDTSIYKTGSLYNLYEPKLDYYFTAIKEADRPQFTNNGSNSVPSNQLFQQVIIPSADETIITITNTYSGYFILTLNGLVLALDYDYTLNGNIVTLNDKTVLGDIITVTYTTSGGNSLVGDNIIVNNPILSGGTNTQGSNTYFFNTTTNKYEIYTSINPSSNETILVMLNGITLASGIDYYQSATNIKRIILEGEIKLNDTITIVYFPQTSVVNNIINNNVNISWNINNPPQTINGVFTLEVGNDINFNTYFFTGTTDYVINQTTYSNGFIASGSIGTQLFYRVKNEKEYVTICGNSVNSINYSDIIPITIATNSINSY